MAPDISTDASGQPWGRPGIVRRCLACCLVIAALGGASTTPAEETDDVFKRWERREPLAPDTRRPTPPGNAGQHQGRARVTDFGDFLPVYSGTTKYADVERTLRDSKGMENVADALNNAFALPTNTRIGAQECQQANAFYQPQSRSIIICYELLESLYTGFLDMYQDEKKALDSFSGAYMFIFLHELGHALISVWELPITGKEEDAVDQLASYLLIQIGEEGVTAAVDAAAWFGLAANSPAAENFADEHSLDQQRYFNILCWIYGSAPDFYKAHITEEFLPKKRAQRCQQEYVRMAKAWDKLLEPFLKR
jgi:hypothetical protein